VRTILQGVADYVRTPIITYLHAWALGDDATVLDDYALTMTTTTTTCNYAEMHKCY